MVEDVNIGGVQYKELRNGDTYATEGAVKEFYKLSNNKLTVYDENQKEKFETIVPVDVADIPVNDGPYRFLFKNKEIDVNLTNPAYLSKRNADNIAKTSTPSREVQTPESTNKLTGEAGNNTPSNTVEFKNNKATLIPDKSVNIPTGDSKHTFSIDLDEDGFFHYYVDGKRRESWSISAKAEDTIKKLEITKNGPEISVNAFNVSGKKVYEQSKDIKQLITQVGHQDKLEASLLGNNTSEYKPALNNPQPPKTSNVDQITRSTKPISPSNSTSTDQTASTTKTNSNPAPEQSNAGNTQLKRLINDNLIKANDARNLALKDKQNGNDPSAHLQEETAYYNQALRLTLILREREIEQQAK